MQYAGWAPLTAFTATLVILWWLLRSRLAKFALDHPNERSLHQTPTPRIGGIGIMLGVALACGLLAPPLPLMLWLALAVLCAVSWFDDMRGMPVLVRLTAHLLAAGALASHLLLAAFGWPVVIITALAIAWMANLYNFMDGADGLAGGMALFGFTFYGVAAWGFTDDMPFVLLNFSIAAAAAAFLVFNFPPARVFMGDVGAVPLGFLAGALGLVGWLEAHWPWWFPLLVFSPFIVDASVTLARRLWHRERVWQAHRDHYYQRLVQLGWGHRRTAGAEYALMAACGSAGLVLSGLTIGGQFAGLGVIAIVYTILITQIESAWRRHQATR